MSRFKYIQRLFWPAVDTPEKLDRALRYLTKWRDACDAVSVFCEGDCLDMRYQSPAESQRRAQWMAVILSQFRDAGFDVHINILNTMGHGDNMDSIDEPVGYPTMVGHDGIQNITTACPRSPEFHAYVANKYKIFAGCAPRVIWVDDDLRMQHHPPVTHGCFCEGCMERFNKEHGYAYTRETLVNELLKDHSPDENTLRMQFLHFNHQAILGVLKTAAEAVHMVDPDIVMGYMTTGVEWNLYNLPDLEACGNALKNRNGEVYFRPGGGCWHDNVPLETVYKGESIARQIAWSNPDAKFYSEIEGMPYMTLTKSPSLTVFELASHIGLGGAHGSMIDLMDCLGNDWSEQEAYLRALCEARPWLSALSDAISMHARVGFYPYLSQSQWQYADEVTELGHMRDMGAGHALQLLHLGVPLTYDKAQSLGTILSGRAAKAVTGAELAEILAKPIFLDGEAAEILIDKMNSPNFFGANPVKVRNSGVYERFTGHVLNGVYAGDIRDANLMYTSGQNMHLTVSEAEVITELFDYHGNALGRAGMVAYERNDGVRTALSAFAPWDDILSLRKREQILNVMAWLCGGTLPVRIDSPVKLAQSIWDGQNDRVVVLYNIGFEPAEKVNVQFDRKGHIERLGSDGRWFGIGEGDKLKIEGVSPWSAVAIRMLGN